MNTVLTLVRHGETQWNRNGRWQGHADVPLSELGRQQAQRLAARLQADGASFDHIYTSDLSRALETAQIVGAALGPSPSPLLELREIDLGSWSGLNREQIEARFPDEWAKMKAGQDIRRGGAESFADLKLRVIGRLQHLAREHAGQRLCIFTHGGVVRAVLAYIQRLDWEQTHQIVPIQNTSLTTISLAADGWRVERVNDAAHLDGLEPAEDLLTPSGEANS